MNSVWITYAWDDNKDGDVDFTAQELIRAGLDVKLDRWNLSAGKRLWEQIEAFIQDPSNNPQGRVPRALPVGECEFLNAGNTRIRIDLPNMLLLVGTSAFRSSFA